jgi:hypothetical protein
VRHDDGWVYRDTRYPYLRGKECKCVTADAPRCIYRKPTPHADSARTAARFEPPVGKRCVEPSRGQAVSFLRGEFLECNDIRVLASRFHEMAWIGLPLAEVR